MKKTRLTENNIEQIRSLRKQGFSILEIVQALSIPKTTVFRYIKGVEMSPDVVKTWFGKRGGSRKRKSLLEQGALKEAQEIIKKISRKEKLLFLCALYWAEGAKADFSLSNTDPNLIKTFVSCAREVFDIDNSQIRASVRIYEDLNETKCLNFWSKIVNIPKKQFGNTTILPGKKKGKLQYGMCRVRVLKGGTYLKKIKAINIVVASGLSL